MIKAIITDVDGVLTDGCMYCSDTGIELKKFNCRDAASVYRLKEADIKLFVITSSELGISKCRIGDMNVDFAQYGILDKLNCARALVNEFGLSLKEVVYIGDDYLDIDLLKAVGRSICPSDALESVKSICDIVSSIKGGDGILAWVVDWLLRDFHNE